MASSVAEQSSQESESHDQKIPGSGGQRSQHVQRLLDAESLPAFLNHLLTQQAIMVAGTEAAGFLIEAAGEEFNLRPIAHIRPDNSDAETRAAALNAFQDLIRPCVTQGKDGAIEVGPPANDTSEAQFCLITLLRSDGGMVAVSAVITRCLNLERARQRLQSMQLVAGYFELFSLRRTAEQSQMIAESHQHAMQLTTAVATAEGFSSAAMGLCNELATRAGATRVSLGWVKGTKVKIKALSHTEEFDKKQELIVMLQRVMEECYDQEQIVQYIPNGQSSDNVTRAAQALSRTQGGHSIISIPLRRRADIVGVVTLEFLPGQDVSPNMSRGLAVAVDLLAPQLYDRHENDRWLITKVGLSTQTGAKMVFGKQHTLAKVIVLLIVGAILFVTLFKPMYHVSAPFEFASIEPNTVIAPFEGKIRDIATRVDEIGSGANVHRVVRRIKPGDHVNKGDVLVQLDTQEADMKLVQAQRQAEAKAEEAHMWEQTPTHTDEQALGKARMAEDERERYVAEAAYYQYQIDRAKITAPIDGYILKGDLEDKLNAPVKLGDELFQIGNPYNLRAELSVDDRDIQDLKNGQIGRVATNALPDNKYDITIDRIIPVGQAKEGSNVFTVYATINGRTSEAWRPGMAGEARVNVEPRRLVWIWTHRLVDFLKLKLWM